MEFFREYQEILRLRFASRRMTKAYLAGCEKPMLRSLTSRFFEKIQTLGIIRAARRRLAWQTPHPRWETAPILSKQPDWEGFSASLLVNQ